MCLLFAKRTYEESGDYYIKEFVTTVRESLNNQEGNRGIYEPGQVTSQGNTPSDDMMVYKVSPGKAYVKGYEVEVRTPSLIDVQSTGGAERGSAPLLTHPLDVWAHVPPPQGDGVSPGRPASPHD